MRKFSPAERELGFKFFVGLLRWIASLVDWNRIDMVQYQWVGSVGGAGCSGR